MGRGADGRGRVVFQPPSFIVNGRRPRSGGRLQRPKEGARLRRRTAAPSEPFDTQRRQAPPDGEHQMVAHLHASRRLVRTTLHAVAHLADTAGLNPGAALGAGLEKSRPPQPDVDTADSDLAGLVRHGRRLGRGDGGDAASGSARLSGPRERRTAKRARIAAARRARREFCAVATSSGRRAFRLPPARSPGHVGSRGPRSHSTPADRGRRAGEPPHHPASRARARSCPGAPAIPPARPILPRPRGRAGPGRGWAAPDRRGDAAGRSAPGPRLTNRGRPAPRRRRPTPARRQSTGREERG